MTQFASTLYPQTNPSNPILLDYRDHIKLAKSLNVVRIGPSEWVRVVEARRHSLSRLWPSAQFDHARRVLTRLAALSG